MGSDNHFNARQDNNQVFSVIGVQGTHGTADTMGTSKTVPLGIDPTTGAAYVYNLGPAGETTIGDIPGGTIDQISGGSIVVTAGTVTTTMGDLSGGTVDLITALASGSVSVIAGTVGTVGAIGQIHNAGTIAALPNIPGGTIGVVSSVTSVANLAKGTVTRVEGGTIGLISSVASLAAGSIAMTAGTITGALPAGTNAVGKMLPPDVDVTTHTNYAKKYYTSAGTVADGIIWSPAAGKRWHVTSMFVNINAAATVTLEDDKVGGDEVVWKADFAANSGAAIYFGEKYPLASGEDAADLTITTSAGTVFITCVGYEI